MDKKIKLGFEKQSITVNVENILPLKKLKDGYKKTRRYRRIKASVIELKVVEPCVVYPQKGAPGTYLLLEGHTRLEIYKELGVSEITCLVSTDDENYTYNQQVNRMTQIQESNMILKTLEAGVSEERVARTLDVNVETIRMKRNFLRGICPEAVALLKKTSIGHVAIQAMKKVHPLRQVEMAELMLHANNLTGAYARALLASTRKEYLLKPEKKKNIAGLDAKYLARMEKEMETTAHDLKMAESSYAPNVLNLVVARGYISKLLDNNKVVRYLVDNRMDLLSEYQRLVQVTALEV